MIQLRDVHKAFGSLQVLRGVSLDIPDGEQLFIVGGSGTGKSVLTKLILGLEQPDQGQISIDDTDIRHFTERDWHRVLQQFGVVFQGAALFDSLNVLENVGIRLFESRRLPAAEIRARVIEALRQVNLKADILEKYPAELSGGMRKRVGIARAIIEEPRYLVYDEPTTGLDPASSEVIDSLIESLAWRQPGRTSLVITHDMHSVRRLASRVVMIYQAQIHFDGPADAFFQSQDEIIAAFLARGRETKGAK
jgi:phospholipid/cholesterol/gamma-HCH transport system ATP-binding protein